jgi:biotin operon repressor
MRTKVNLAELAGLWERSNLTLPQIAEKLGITTGHVWKVARSHGLKPRGRKNNHDIPRLFKLWSDKSLSCSQVAAEFGVSRTQVFRLASRYGLPKRPSERLAENTVVDPTPAQIAERAAEIRERNMERMKQQESFNQTDHGLRCFSWRGDHYESVGV